MMKFLRTTPLLAVVLLAAGTSAADSSTGGDLPNLSSATQASSGNTAATTGASSGASSAGTTAGGSTSGTVAATITGGGSAGATTGTVPSITGSSAANTDGGLTGLPTLSGAYKIVAASVPPTQNAPYMQQSSLPEGTVFIAVGAILGFMAMSVLLWRGLVAWSLHRSVKRAALQQNMSDTKALFSAPGPPPPFYKNQYTDRESTISLSGLGAKGNRKSVRPPTAPGARSSTSLFFSPTAGAAAGGLNAAGNRASSYLPAGYYAAGAAQTGNGHSHVSMGGHGPAISLSNLGPQAAGYNRARSMGPSPPDSPSMTASRSAHMASSSTLNLTQGYGGEQRAPSAYLEDLFDGESPQPGQGGARDSQHRF